MQKIHVLCVGKIKQNMYAEAIQEFIDRLKKIIQFTIIELPDSKQVDILKKQNEETNFIIEYIQSHPSVYVALDEHGAAMTSQEFSQYITKYKDTGETITFIIGGAYGFTNISPYCQKTTQLSAYTFTHELARLILLEQLYRALQIQKGTGYHH